MASRVGYDVHGGRYCGGLDRGGLGFVPTDLISPAILAHVSMPTAAMPPSWADQSDDHTARIRRSLPDGKSALAKSRSFAGPKYARSSDPRLSKVMVMSDHAEQERDLQERGTSSRSKNRIVNTTCKRACG
jgi:hypothetical protein